VHLHQHNTTTSVHLHYLGAASMTARLDPTARDAWRAVLTGQAHVVRRVERALADAGLPPLAWYDVLWSLYKAPGRRLRIRHLADEVVLSPTGMSRLVDRVEAAGLLRREPSPEDRRGAYAVLTADGLACLRRMWPVYERELKAFVAAQLGDDAATVRDALRRVAEAARAD
jgi:DNA-binding MarR family transcriptional regulator